MVKRYCPTCRTDHERFAKCPRYDRARANEPSSRRSTWDCDRCGERHPVDRACPKPPRVPGEHLRRRPYRKWYAHARWFRLRDRVLNSSSFCVKCDRPADVVDHIKPHRGVREMFYEITNLQAMCKKCHDIKTGSGQ